jgi:anti-sigma factor (TIGR02949 family)
VLDQVQEYLHHELEPDRYVLVRQHLAECNRCLQEYGLEEVVRELLNRSCHCTPAPEALRSAVMQRITTIRFDTFR